MVQAVVRPDRIDISARLCKGAVGDVVETGGLSRQSGGPVGGPGLWTS